MTVTRPRVIEDEVPDLEVEWDRHILYLWRLHAYVCGNSPVSRLPCSSSSSSLLRASPSPVPATIGLAASTSPARPASHGPRVRLRVKVLFSVSRSYPAIT